METNLPEEEGISLKKIVLIVKEYFIHIRKNKKMILLSMVIFLGFGIYYYSESKVKYTAVTTFMINQDDGGIKTGLLKIVGQLSGISSEKGVNAEKLVELITTRRIIEDALLREFEIEGKLDFLSNHYIDIFGLNSEWKDHPILDESFRLKSSKRSDFGIKENYALGYLYSIIKGRIIAENSLNGLITLQFISTNEVFTLYFAQSLTSTLSDFYVSKTIEQQNNTYKILKLRVDSVVQNLKEAELKLAKFKDESNRLVKAQGNLTQLRLKRDVEVLNAMYIEGTKNLEFAKVSLLDKTPIIQIVDNPSLPLSKKRSSLPKVIIGSILAGLLLPIGFIIGRIKCMELINAFNN